MGKKPANPIDRLRSAKRPGLTARLESVRYLNAVKSRRTVPIGPLVGAVIAAGHTSLDSQAKALGLRRSTTWTIMKTKHKLGHLNAKTTQQILENSDTPASVRAFIEEALEFRMLRGTKIQNK